MNEGDKFGVNSICQTFEDVLKSEDFLRDLNIILDKNKKYDREKIIEILNKINSENSDKISDEEKDYMISFLDDSNVKKYINKITSLIPKLSDNLTGEYHPGNKNFNDILNKIFSENEGTRYIIDNIKERVANNSIGINIDKINISQSEYEKNIKDMFLPLLKEHGITEELFNSKFLPIYENSFVFGEYYDNDGSSSRSKPNSKKRYETFADKITSWIIFFTKDFYNQDIDIIKEKIKKIVVNNLDFLKEEKRKLYENISELVKSKDIGEVQGIYNNNDRIGILGERGIVVFNTNNGLLLSHDKFDEKYKFENFENSTIKISYVKENIYFDEHLKI